MKKILIFSLAYYPRFVGGAEVALKELTDRLGDEYEFHMVTLRKHAPAFERIGKVQVCRVGMPWRGKRTASFKFFPFSKIMFPLLAARKGIALHKEHHYDAVWGMMAAHAGLAAMFFKLANPTVPFVLTLQEGVPISDIKRKALPIYPLFKMVFTRANFLQAISNYLLTFGKDMGFVGPAHMIPNGVDGVRFQGEPMSHEGTVLVTSSRLVHKNAVDVVIRALPLLPNVRFLVLGTGPDREALEALAQKLNVANRVMFEGFVDHADLPRRLHAADIFIRPSRSEGMGNSFIEAFAAGLPVIATQEGGIADFLFDTQRNPDKPTTGWAVDKDNPEQIAAAVRDILANPEYAKQVVETARTLALEKYDWNLIAKEMSEKIFSKI